MIEDFEQQAERFYSDVGFMAPGKSEPAAGIGQLDFDRHEVRRILKDLWDKKEQQLRAMAARMPAELRDRSIFFTKCAVGHGSLVAENWIKTDCQVCRADSAERALKQTENERARLSILAGKYCDDLFVQRSRAESAARQACEAIRLLATLAGYAASTRRRSNTAEFIAGLQERIEAAQKWLESAV